MTSFSYGFTGGKKPLFYTGFRNAQLLRDGGNTHPVEIVQHHDFPINFGKKGHAREDFLVELPFFLGELVFTDCILRGGTVEKPAGTAFDSVAPALFTVIRIHVPRDAPDKCFKIPDVRFAGKAVQQRQYDFRAQIFRFLGSAAAMIRKAVDLIQPGLIQPGI